MRRPAAVAVLAAMLALLPACSNRTDETSRAAGITPRDAVAFVSVSLDPSVAQKRNLLSIARRFPKARDKVRKDFQQTRDSFLADAVDGACLDYGRDVKPWLGSELAVARVPRRGTGTGSSSTSGAAATVVFVKARDQAKARQALERALAGPCPASPGTGDRQFRMVKGFAVIAADGDRAANTAVLDEIGQQATAPGGGLAGTDRFRRLESNLHGDRLLVGFVDADAVLGRRPNRCDPVAAFGGQGPVAFDLHVGPASVVLEGVTEPAASSLHSGDPKLTQALPADSTGTLTVFDVASVVRTALACSGQPDQLQGQFADGTGADLEADVLSWMDGEAVVVAGPPHADGSMPDFALVVAPTDDGKAASAVEKLKKKLAGDGELQEFDAGAAKGTTVAPRAKGGTRPAMVLLPDRFILATSPGYVQALTREGGPALGRSTAYRDVVGDGTADGTRAQLFVRIAAVRDAVARNLPAEARQAYDRDVAPQLDPLDAFGIRIFERDGLSHVEVKLTLK